MPRLATVQSPAALDRQMRSNTCRAWHRKPHYNRNRFDILVEDQIYNASLDLLVGRGVARDEERSFALNAEAAKGGHADAVLAMGWFYQNGIGVTGDIEKAKKWYRESARRGEPMAMFNLGQIAYHERDFSDALQWFSRAAEAGHARSLYWLGKLYWRGHGVERDRKQAKRLFHQAATRKVAEAQRLLRFWT